MTFTSGDRLERLLAAIPWIVANDGPTVDEVSKRFDYPVSRLAQDLETVFLVGVPPYTPDSLISVIVEDGRVWISFADYFEKPLRLTPAQALALVAAGSSLIDLPMAEADPLRRGLDKLATALGLDIGDSLDVQLGTAGGETLERIRTAISENRKLLLDYYAYGRDERADRVVQPHRVFAAEGEWYLTAHCESADGERVFRLDRIHGLELLEATFTRPADDGEMATFRAQDDDPRVVLLLEEGGRWVADAYPVEAVSEASGARLRVTLAVSALPWLERLLLQLGPDAIVLEADERLPDRIAQGAAERILARYARP